MNNGELRELVHLLLMCGIMDKTATESGNVTDEEWLRMKTLIEKYQAEGGINCEPDKSGDLISRSYLKNLPFERVIHTDFGDTAIPIEEIDNAPAVETKELTPLVNKVVEVLPELTDAIIDVLPEIVSKLIKCSECSYYRDTWNVIPRYKGEWIIHNKGELNEWHECPYCNNHKKYYANFCDSCGADLRKGGKE